jgi:hypothetical protein
MKDHGLQVALADLNRFSSWKPLAVRALSVMHPPRTQPHHECGNRSRNIEEGIMPERDTLKAGQTERLKKNEHHNDASKHPETAPEQPEQPECKGPVAVRLHEVDEASHPNYRQAR